MLGGKFQLFTFGYYEAYLKGQLISIKARTENILREGRSIYATSF